MVLKKVSFPRKSQQANNKGTLVIITKLPGFQPNRAFKLTARPTTPPDAI